MAYSIGTATTDMNHPEFLVERAHIYDFFQLVWLLQQLQENDPESDEWEKSGSIRFCSNPGLGFASSDISKLSYKGNRFEIETQFLGLSGSQSPLPNYILDLLVEDESGIRNAFLNFFNNRLTSLLYRSWRKYRYYVQFQHDAKDKFSGLVFALIGLYDCSLRSENNINWSKMLAYAGTLASRSRSPKVLSGIISHFFDLTSVYVEQWQFRWVEIPKNQQTYLGDQNCQLGKSTMVGRRVADVGGKFTLCLEDLDLERFLEFLPSGNDFLPLCRLIEIILREQMAYELKLNLKASEHPVFSLDKEGISKLGWSTFLGNASFRKESSVLIKVRQ